MVRICLHVFLYATKYVFDPNSLKYTKGKKPHGGPITLGANRVPKLSAGVR